MLIDINELRTYSFDLEQNESSIIKSNEIVIKCSHFLRLLLAICSFVF